MSLGETLQNVNKSRKPNVFPKSELWLFFNLIPTKSQGLLIMPCPTPIVPQTQFLKNQKLLDGSPSKPDSSANQISTSGRLKRCPSFCKITSGMSFFLMVPGRVTNGSNYSQAGWGSKRRVWEFVIAIAANFAVAVGIYGNIKWYSKGRFRFDSCLVFWQDRGPHQLSESCHQALTQRQDAPPFLYESLMKQLCGYMCH